MNNIKVIVVTFLATLILSVGFSVGAALIIMPADMNSHSSTPKLSEAAQIAIGYKYNIYTGAKLNIPTPTLISDPTPKSTTPSTTIVTPTLSATELRFRAIETRLDKLENK